MDPAYWGVVAVVVIGTAVVWWGWWRDRKTNQEWSAILRQPPDRQIPDLEDNAHPTYVQPVELPAAPAGPALSEARRDDLRGRLRASPSFAAGSPGFATDPATGWCVLERPLILVCEEPPVDLHDLLPAIRRAKAASRPLVIVAPEVPAPVAGTLLANHLAGTLRCAAVRLSGADKRLTLASLVGARPASAADLRSGWLDNDSLGTIRTWLSDDHHCWLLS